MFGRYSLDKPGLILANQGETLEDYLKQIPQPQFKPDADNVIPILSDNYFKNDIVEYFNKFLKITFGEANYKQNLDYIESCLAKDSLQKTKAKKTTASNTGQMNIRKYFLTNFYTDHVKRYKKRPIYWLFSSPKGSFNAIIYMHRYREDTVSIILDKYLREFMVKLENEVNFLESSKTSKTANAADLKKNNNEIEKIKAVIKELKDYERNIIYPLATSQLKIDLDDGVKVNYAKFGKALKTIKG